MKELVDFLTRIPQQKMADHPVRDQPKKMIYRDLYDFDTDRKSLFTERRW